MTIRGEGKEQRQTNKMHFQALEVVFWVIGLKSAPTLEQIGRRWSVSRVSSYRWRVSLGEVWARANADTDEARAP